MTSSHNMSITDQDQETNQATYPAEYEDVLSLNRLKLRLSQLEMQLSRLAVVFGLDYGSLQKLAPCFLRVKCLLLKLAQQHRHDDDLVDLAESLLTEASDHDLCELEEQLLCMRRHAQDPAKHEYADSYQALMSDLLQIEQALQAALQKALGNIAG